MMFLSRYRSLRILSVLVFSTAIFAIASPMTSADATQIGPIQRDLLFAEMRSNAPLGSATFSTSPGEFRFITPITSNPHDPTADLDESLLPYLTVSICRVAGSECLPVRSFNSQGASAERLRVETKGVGSYFIVNWDVSRGSIDNLSVYRITVDAAGIKLGSVDLGPSTYKPFGRTWPIKFIIETDAALRTQILAAAGMSLWEIADDLRTELGICDDDLRQLLIDNYPDATVEQVAEVVNGVCQDVELLPTTKIADRATRDALVMFDMSTGRMVFAGDTPLLKNLHVNDVIASRPGPAAPYGYLRKVTSLRKDKGIYTLETVQAKFTEAIRVGTLQVSGPLVPSSQTLSGRRGLKAEPNAGLVSKAFDEGDQLTFTRHIDEEINLEGGDDEIGGTGKVRVIGDIDIKAGYNIGAGIEWCGIVPCTDRLEAWMGFEHKSSLRIIGTFDGKVHKEIPYPIPMQPIFFMIGFLPVVLVPEVNVIVGIDGEAHISFEFAAGSDVKMKPYIKWTDDNGWQDLTQIDDPLSKTFTSADITGTIEMEVFAKLDASLLLYGAIGPSMDGSLGIGGTAQTGQRPLWTVFGHAKVGIGLRSLFTELFDIGSPREALLDEKFLIKEAENQPPVFSNVRDGSIQARVNRSVYVGPDDGLAGKNYDVFDPEGDIPELTVSAPDGVVSGLRVTYATPGLKTVKITARDSDGLTQDLYLGVDVRNSPPIVTITPDSGEIPANTQYWLTATAYDPEEGTLRCSRLTWSATGAHTKIVSTSNRTCAAVFKFNDPGLHTVTASATDSLGATMFKEHSVLVSDPPDVPYPEIVPDSFSIQAISRIRRRDDDPTELGCIPGIFCEVENGDLIYNGYGGDFIPPLIMRLEASDPSGAPLIIDWRCQTGENFAPVTYNGDGSYSCTPIYSPLDPIKVYAFIYTPPPPFGEGNGPATKSEERTFFMLQAPN